MARAQDGRTAERPPGAEYMKRMREGGYGSDRDPATADDGARDVTRGASAMPAPVPTRPTPDRRAIHASLHATAIPT